MSCVTRRNALTGEPVKESLENPGGRHASHGTGGWSGLFLKRSKSNQYAYNLHSSFICS